MLRQQQGPCSCACATYTYADADADAGTLARIVGWRAVIPVESDHGHREALQEGARLEQREVRNTSSSA